MRAVIATALLLFLGEASAAQPEQVISVQHDSQRGVTCWILNKSGISCLPDSSLLQRQAATPTPESETARASLVKSTGESNPMTAAPLPQDERFQL